MAINVGGLLLGLINIGIVVVVLLIVGYIAMLILNALQWAVPDQLRKLYLALVGLIALYMIVALLLGLPTVRIL